MQKRTVLKGSDIENKGKNASVQTDVFEER